MTAAQAENPVTEAVRSPEVRWIFPGQAGTAVAGWFGRFPAGVESREDAYLVSPDLRGLSVKAREHGALEVKAYRGSPGILEVAGRARDRPKFWQKWSFPCGPIIQGGAASPGWVLVHKRISRFSLASGQIQAQVLGPGEEPGCMVELTEVHRHGEARWALGFEATGPASLLRRELEATATLVLAQPLPVGMELDTVVSRICCNALERSWMAWSGRRGRRRPGAGQAADVSGAGRHRLPAGSLPGSTADRGVRSAGIQRRYRVNCGATSPPRRGVTGR